MALYITNFYKTYLQNLKDNIKGACILVGILSILILFVKNRGTRDAWFFAQQIKFVKRDKSYLSTVPGIL